MLGYILKKWYIVLFCALIGAGALYVEKAQVAPSTAINGDLLYTRTVQIDPVPVAEFGGVAQEINLEKMLTSWRASQSLVTDWGRALDFDKLCKGWAQLKQKDRSVWVTNHVQVLHVGPGTYELAVQFSSTDAKDTTYIQENDKLLMDTFTGTVAHTVAAQIGNAEVKTVENFNLVDTGEVVTQGGLRKKYVIIGFVLGALAGTAVLAVFSLRGRNRRNG